ncbi:unnamed protein product [Penicillium olsonii]|nr:unnamed protein product [Penicillium olsonii]
MEKSADEHVEFQEKPDHKGSVLEQDALYQAYASKDSEWHQAMTKRLLRKVDWHLLPFLILMYLLNFLDRNNLSQARLGTLEEDLGMGGTDYNLATSILFVGYLLMQLPSNLILTRVRPSLFLGSAMAIWGVISACQAAITSFSGLIVTRFFLGFVEAPFFPGAVMLMSSWYTRQELSHRIAWFYAGSSLANAFGGLIGAGVLGNLSGAQGIAGWRWLFIIEGCITVGISLLSAIFLPNYPASTSWLDEEEQGYAQWRLMHDAGEADEVGSTSIKEALALVFADKRIYLFILLQHVSLLSQNFQYFFPTIVQTLGYGNVETLLITAPVWIATFFVSLLVTWTSGKTNDRSIHIMCLMMVSVVGGIICTVTTNIGAKFFAMFLMPMGAVSAYQIIIAWVANSFPRPLVKRSAAIAVANMIGNTASIYGSYMWPASSGPRYIPGGSATAAIAFLVAVLAFVIRLVHAHMNKRLEEEENSGSQPSGLRELETRSASFTSIPILDFSHVKTSKSAFLEALRDALVNVGFFYLRDAPVPIQIQDDFIKKALELFDLPLEKKLEIEMVNSPHFLGYSRLCAEITALKPDHREQFDFATELPAPGPDEPLYRNVVGPNQWPDEKAVPGFRKAFDDYLSELSTLAESFQILIAEALDLPSNALDQVFDKPQQHKLKLIKYPAPTTTDNGDSGFQGVGPHKDSGFLTFLLQGTPHHGLEVQNKNGTWISAPPIPGTLVVNIGRSLEALTGGICTATTHRVSLRPENFESSDGSLGPRFSFPVFQGVSLDLSADKISLQIPDSVRSLVKDEKVKSDAEATFNKMFHGCIGEGTFVARVTSHQDVGQRWYPEVLQKALKGQKDFLV